MNFTQFLDRGAHCLSFQSSGVTLKAAFGASNKAGMELKNEGPKLFWLIHTQQAESFTVILFGWEEKISRRTEGLFWAFRSFGTAKEHH